MEIFPNIKINTASRVPKYKQIMDAIIEHIAKGRLEIGQKLPSINEVSEEYYLSRDTVEKAYQHLKERKIIVSVKGKGHYVARTSLIAKVNVLFLINKLSSYKMLVFNSFVKKMETSAQVDLQIYHFDDSIFVNLVEKNMGAYDYYLIMPHFRNKDADHTYITSKAIASMQKIPKERLIILDYHYIDFGHGISKIYQDFENDIYDALSEGQEKLKKYQKLILVYPTGVLYPYPKEIVKGFRKFCLLHTIDFEVLDKIYEGMELQEGDAYITIRETDLVNLVKQIRESDLHLGQEIGVISYNDTPLKELLDITCISTDFKLMGEKAAHLILENKIETIKNEFNFIDRKSF